MYKRFLLFIITCIAMVITSESDAQKRKRQEIPLDFGPQFTTLSKDLPAPPPEVEDTFQAKQFDFTTISGLSNSQLDQHTKLYHGYVKKSNEIVQSLKTVNRTDAAGITYSPFRALKIAQTFAFNGVILHELYFQNLGKSKKIGSKTEQLLIKNFGSIEDFKKDLLASASCARGWVLTCYSIYDGKVYNFVLDAHNETVPVLVLPILVIDIYEHAYMIDFGIDRAKYLQVIWKNIDWDVVEERVIKWVEKFEA